LIILGLDVFSIGKKFLTLLKFDDKNLNFI